MGQAIKQVSKESAKRPSREDRAPRGGGLAIVSGLLGGALLVIDNHVIAPTRTRRWWPWAKEIAADVRPWTGLIGLVLLILAGAVLIIWLAFTVHHYRRRKVILSITQAAANALHVERSMLRLKRAKWRKGGVLESADLRYASANQVVQDLSKELLAGLSTYLAGRSSIKWDRKRQKFTIRPRPARLEEKHASVKHLAAALSPIVGELSIDQDKTTVDVDGSVQRFVARYRHTTKDIGEGFRLRIQTVVDAKAPSSTGYWSVSWTPEANSIELKPAAPLPTVAPYPADLPEPADQMKIPLGVGEGGKVVHWLPETLPHMLLVGPTGTGKTVFIFSLVVSCLARGWSVILIDPKELSFRGFDPEVLQRRGLQKWPGIDMIATSESDMEHALGSSHDRMRDRYAALKYFAVKESDLRPLLVIVDETGEMAERLNEFQQSPEKKAQAEAEGRKAGGAKNPELRKLWSNLRLGRQGRVFVVTATQRPDVTFIPGEARSNLTTRVGLGRLEGQALEMVFNTRAVQQRMTEVVKDPNTGERVSKRIRGRANIDVGGGVQTVQTFWVPDPAKLITNELGAADVAKIGELQHLVLNSRDRWNWQREAPNAGERAEELDNDSVLLDLSKQSSVPVVEEELDPVELSAAEVGSPVRGRDLEVGMRVLMTLEGEEVEVEVEDLAEDSIEPDLIEVSLRPDDGVGFMTTISPDEELTLIL